MFPPFLTLNFSPHTDGFSFDHLLPWISHDVSFLPLLSLVALTSSYWYAWPPQTLVFGLSHQMKGTGRLLDFEFTIFLTGSILLGFKFECPLLRFWNCERWNPDGGKRSLECILSNPPLSILSPFLQWGFPWVEEPLPHTPIASYNVVPQYRFRNTEPMDHRLEHLKPKVKNTFFFF